MFLGLGIFFDKAGDMVPTVYEEFLRKFEAQQEVHVFLHLRALSKPHVSDEDRYTISSTSIPNCYRLTVHHGYNDRVISAELGDVVYHELRKAIVKMVDLPTSAAPSSSKASQPESIAESSAVAGSVSTSLRVTTIPETSALEVVQINDIAIDRRIAVLDSAFQKQVVYIVGKEELRLLVEKNNIFKRILLGIYTWLRQNTHAKIAQMEIPVEKLVEVGFVKEI